MNSSTLIDKLWLVSSDYIGRASLYEQFYLIQGVQIAKDWEGIKDLDCLIVPCSNGFGLKEGIPKEIQPLINSKVERLVKNYIIDNYCGEQPAGTAFIISIEHLISTSTTNKKKDAQPKLEAPNLCWFCCGRTPETITKDSAYIFIWSSLTTIKAHNKKIKEKKKRINVVSATVPSFKSHDMAENCRQASIAIKRFLEGPGEAIDKEAAQKLEESIIKPVAITTEEREKELEGLLWSRELETRGICNEAELDILINWVNEQSDNNKKAAHNLAAAKALVALLKREDTEFTMKCEAICERITRKDKGCLPRLLDLGLSGELELHKEIARTDLEILGKIGDGNAGSVYKGKYKGMDVAVKLFTKGTVSNSQDFKRELAMLSLIKHPLVVGCYGGSTKPGDEFLVTELMEASVYDLLHDESFPMDIEMKLDFAISTARCMHFLHSCGLIHRDLKSLNLLVSKKYDVKICDFGLSRVLDSKSEMTKNIGTVAWIAPELFAKRFYTEKADVYSYGVILWELMTRKMPFSDVESFSIPLLVSRGERPPISKDCPADWKKLIKICWHQKAQKRPDFKRILQKLRVMVERLRDKRIADGQDLNTERGLFLRNSSFITDDYSTPTSGGSSENSGGVPGHRKHSGSGRDTDSDYSDSTISMSSTISLSASEASHKGKRERAPADRD